MSSKNQHKEIARAFARETLSSSSAFRNLDRKTQFKMYNDLVQQKMHELQGPNGQNMSESMFVPHGRLRKARNAPNDAGDLVNPELHENKNLDKAGQRAADFIDRVDFPSFVRDLLKGVFDANLEVTQKQMEEYRSLLKQASRDIAYFINKIDNTAAFGYLAENNDDEFGISFPPMDDEDSAPVVLTDKEGNPVDTEDTKIKGKIMDAKIQMAKEHRAMLREALLMGINRLVVEKGEVEASVMFQINSRSTVARGEKARLNRQLASKQYRMGISPIPFAQLSRGTSERKETQISIASLNSTQNDELSAKMAGKVKIHFKTDYFKADKWAEIINGPTGAEADEAKKKAQG